MALKAVPHPHAQKTGGLPVLVISPTDLGRLIRELEALSEHLLQMTLRNKEGHEIKMPHTSMLMDKTLEVNKVDLMSEDQRKQLHEFLVASKAQAPVIHMSFSADPAPVFLEKIITWFRSEVHPLALITVGLQPNLGAGCILRTTNKQFDLSLKQDFLKKRDILMEAINAKVKAPAAPQEVPA